MLLDVAGNLGSGGSKVPGSSQAASQTAKPNDKGHSLQPQAAQGAALGKLGDKLHAAAGKPASAIPSISNDSKVLPEMNGGTQLHGPSDRANSTGLKTSAVRNAPPRQLLGNGSGVGSGRLLASSFVKALPAADGYSSSKAGPKGKAVGPLEEPEEVPDDWEDLAGPGGAGESIDSALDGAVEQRDMAPAEDVAGAAASRGAREELGGLGREDDAAAVAGLLTEFLAQAGLASRLRVELVLEVRHACCQTTVFATVSF